MTWTELSGRGNIYSYSIVRRSVHPAFTDRLPIVIAVVQLVEGPQMVTTIVDCAPEAVTIGMDVSVLFEALTDHISLPVFRPGV